MVPLLGDDDSKSGDHLNKIVEILLMMLLFALFCPHLKGVRSSRTPPAKPNHPQTQKPKQKTIHSRSFPHTHRDSSLEDDEVKCTQWETNSSSRRPKWEGELYLVALLSWPQLSTNQEWSNGEPTSASVTAHGDGHSQASAGASRQFWCDTHTLKVTNFSLSLRWQVLLKRMARIM